MHRDSQGIATRRPRVPRPLLAVLLVALLAVGYLALVTAADRDDGAGSDAEGADPNAAGRADRSEPERSGQQPRATAEAAVFASVDSDDAAPVLELVLPHADPLGVVFHEASRAEALTLVPVGTLGRNDNPAGYEPVAEDPDGATYHVAASLGRGRPATSAVEVAVPEAGIALAPAAGTVVEVRQYPTAVGLRDWRVVVEPTARPDLHVVVAHLTAPQVAVGDEVSAGRSPLGGARQLPRPDALDELLDGPHPSVLLEVKPAGAAEPLDPNAPALPPEDTSEDTSEDAPEDAPENG